jgi:hypothetical protein
VSVDYVSSRAYEKSASSTFLRAATRLALSVKNSFSSSVDCNMDIFKGEFVRRRELLVVDETDASAGRTLLHFRCTIEI